MTLTVGRGPFGHQPAGTFNFEPPSHVLFIDPFPRRVRAVKGGETVVDSERVKLVYETGALPHYSFPREDVKLHAEPDPGVEGHVVVAWDAVDAWFEEDEEVHVHPRDPYHRIDTVVTSRHIQVSVAGTVLADTTRAVALYETALPVRWYLPFHDLRPGLIEPSPTVSRCAYKGTAGHWSARVGGELVEDVAWSYEDEVFRDGEPVRGRIAFYNERVDLSVDGVAQQRPLTPWTRR